MPARPLDLFSLYSCSSRGGATGLSAGGYPMRSKVILCSYNSPSGSLGPPHTHLCTYVIYQSRAVGAACCVHAWWHCNGGQSCRVRRRCCQCSVSFLRVVSVGACGSSVAIGSLRCERCTGADDAAYMYVSARVAEHPGG